ncbi:MAG: hypothetical protein AAB612_00355, partial [Patescibacteria group bacterium]
ETSVEDMVRNGRGKFIGMLVRSIEGDSALSAQIHLLSDRRSSEREKKVALHDLVNDYFFKKLSLGLQYILIQALSGATEKYPDLKTFHNDLVVLLVCETCIREDTALERCGELSPDIRPFVLHMINLRFHPSKSPKENRESKSKLLQQISALAPDPGPPPIPIESLKEKGHRLTNVRRDMPEHLPSYILNASMADRDYNSLIELHQHFPNDPEIMLWKKAAEAAKSFEATNVKKDYFLEKLYEVAAKLLVFQSDEGRQTFVSLEEMQNKMDEFCFSVAVLCKMADIQQNRVLQDEIMKEVAKKMLKEYITDQQLLLSSTNIDEKRTDLLSKISDAIQWAKTYGLGEFFETEDNNRSV